MTTRVVPRADEVLRRFFADAGRSLTGRRSERLVRAEADLRAAVEALAPRMLTGPELALLALERQFGAEPAARVLGADAVLAVLPVYLADFHWQGEGLEDRILRIRLAEPLAHEIVRLPELRGRRFGAAIARVDAAVRHETWLVRQEREAARLG